MLFRNFTPFPTLQFESRDEKRRDFGVVALRGTFRIDPFGPLRLVQKQAPLVMTDEYFGRVTGSSLRCESSLAPYKPRTDVHIQATAHAPNRRPAASWPVAVEVGELRKELLVTGPRYWKWDAKRGWVLSDPLPVPQVPIRYEHAFGGSRTVAGGTQVCEENPVGVGFADPATADRSKPVAVPQILPPNSPPPELGKPIPVEGLGPVPPAWLPRRAKAGTFDAVWEKTRWPDLPEDFSFGFYNSAAPGLTCPGFLRGDEVVRLTNLTPDGSLLFWLPSFELALLLRFQDGRIVPSPVHLDTVHVDVQEQRAYLTWRGVFPLTSPLRVLEVRMRGPADVVKVSKPEPATAKGDVLKVSKPAAVAAV